MPRCVKIGLLILVFISAVSSENSTVLSRRRRYLNFPAKANLVMTCSLLKAIPRDIKVGPSVSCITFHELDVLFPLPHQPSPYVLSQTALGQPPVFQETHSRHRRAIFNQLEEMFYLYGFDGRSCILKTLCEAKQLMPTDGENLIQDLLMIIFRLPDNEKKDKDYHVAEPDCGKLTKSCLLSIFDTAFDWAKQYYNELNSKMY